MGKISRILVVAVALAASAGATMRATDEIFAMRRAYRKVQRVPATRRGAGTGLTAGRLNVAPVASSIRMARRSR